MQEFLETTEQKSKSFSKSAIDDVLKDSLQLGGSKQFIQFFRFLSRFNYYSFFNSSLIYIQNREVAYYGSRYFWKKKFNRKINNNARPYIILTPFSPITIVYDIVDTIGNKSIEELLEIGLPFNPFQVKGKISEKVYNDLRQNINKWQIPIYTRPLSYFNAGHITVERSGRLEICVCSKKTKEETFSTIIHELAHLMLGHTQCKYLINRDIKDSKIKLAQRANMNISSMELEAEIIAFLICNRYDLETTSIEYLTGYIQGEASIKNFSYNTVIKTADKIINIFLKS